MAEPTTIAAERQTRGAESSYTWGLLVMTVATGVVDGVSYLGLDRVFTGNMTGNVLFIGFGVAKVDGLPVLNPVLALVGFVAGAVAGARLLTSVPDVTRLPRRALAMLAGSAALALLLAGMWAVLPELGKPTLGAFTAVLAMLMGGQAAALKTIGIRDLNSVVVTMTLVTFSTQLPIAGGDGKHSLRRLGAFGGMGLGALIGAVSVRLVGGPFALVVLAAIMCLGLVLLWRARAREAALNSSEVRAPVPAAPVSPQR